MQHRQIKVDPSHAVFAGHFPGRPIVPGMLLLQWLIVELKNQLKIKRVLGFPAVKFRQPITPEELLIMTTNWRGENIVDFEIASAGVVVADGQIKVELSENEAR